MLQPAAEAQRPEHPEDQPVHVEERQPMGEHVVGRPRPGIGQGIDCLLYTSRCV